mmetsp:Transcript_57376/g.136372  ORF Transcript_57376/g.136372 Transcript_57376/m.136372 type:complete len:207 (-) Transcript_57376:166-786(-)|eukprot:CAMPEP_0178397396 /NCGR_PEP_ID=MMETSP0689_2-20121128/14222_1 /TAXON_ID=160604 /ORGANISM="Amphidinium massartii, Strain CS-259" /LENGTH=206 /DNA_ID=CAMNT_0020018099 /DNA_START=237 /DNA_END=857 /DNA_ORIENTATION=+
MGCSSSSSGAEQPTNSNAKADLAAYYASHLGSDAAAQLHLHRHRPNKVITVSAQRSSSKGSKGWQSSGFSQRSTSAGTDRQFSSGTSRTSSRHFTAAKGSEHVGPRSRSSSMQMSSDITPYYSSTGLPVGQEPDRETTEAYVEELEKFLLRVEDNPADFSCAIHLARCRNPRLNGTGDITYASTASDSDSSSPADVAQKARLQLHL